MLQSRDDPQKNKNPDGSTPEKTRPPMVSIVGNSGVGKTTLLEKLIPVFIHRGFRVGAVKHDVHGFQMDKPGKDSWRHKQAGASAAIISSPRQVGMVMDVDVELRPEELLRLLPPVDIVLLEGYKRASHPKIEVFRSEIYPEPICGNDSNLIALVSNEPLDLGIKRFSLNDISGLAEFIISYFGLTI